MPKHDFLSAKAVANRQKAKGLQRLRWYCQMCEKQCRDEAGFRCHMTSEGHLRQMQIVARNPDMYVERYSQMFEQNFLEALRKRHGTRKVKANHLYNELISHREHIHMNATRWTTLSEFVQYLGREGKCIVEETERGWDVQYIDRDPRLLARQENAERRQRDEMDEETRQNRRLRKQMEAAHAVAKASGHNTALDEGEGEEAEQQEEEEIDEQKRQTDALRERVAGPAGHAEAAVSLNLSKASRKRALPAFQDDEEAEGDGDDDDVEGQAVSEAGHRHRKKEHASGGRKRPRQSGLAALMQEEQDNKESVTVKGASATMPAPAATQSATRASTAVGEARAPNPDVWLYRGIVVKVLSKKLAGGAYHKRKGTIRRVLEDEAAAELKMADSGDVVTVPQKKLETVIPKPGGSVILLTGAHRGCRATLLAIDAATYSCRVRVEEGPHQGDELGGIEYETLSRGSA